MHAATNRVAYPSFVSRLTGQKFTENDFSFYLANEDGSKQKIDFNYLRMTPNGLRDFKETLDKEIKANEAKFPNDQARLQEVKNLAESKLRSGKPMSKTFEERLKESISSANEMMDVSDHNHGNRFVGNIIQVRFLRPLNEAVSNIESARVEDPYNMIAKALLAGIERSERDTFAHFERAGLCLDGTKGIISRSMAEKIKNERRQAGVNLV